MNYIYSSGNYHLTFFTKETDSKKLQDFIQVCTQQDFAYSVTPYGVTSVTVLRSQRDSLVEVFERFFSGERKQETMVLNANTASPAFVPYNPSFKLDLKPFIGAKGQVIKRGVQPTEVLHFLDLHEDMLWSFVEKTMSLPARFGKQAFLPGQVLTRFDVETYFSCIEEITPYLGRNGYFQVLYKTAAGKAAFCKKYYQEGAQSWNNIQPTHKGQIPSPAEYVLVKPMWYDCEYK